MIAGIRDSPWRRYRFVAKPRGAAMTRLRNAVAATVIAMLPSLSSADERVPVDIPPMMAEHMLANMRDHLAALGEIAAALGALDGSAAASVAETRLGLSSLQAHGAAHIAQAMPEGMQEAGLQMHRAASRLALLAQTADVAPTVEDMTALFAAYGEVVGACTACHAGWRLR
jgi:cytochrome c556